MKRNRLPSLAAIVLIVGLLLSACAPQVVEKTVEVTKVVEKSVPVEVTKVVEKPVQVVVTPTPAPTASKAAQFPLAKIRVSTGGNITQLDPTLAIIAPAGMVATLANGYLFRWNQEHEAIPELVDTYSVAKDGLTITMTLKANLKYSDGSPLTIDDVLYNWDRIYKAPITDKGLTKDVASLTAPDKSTLVWKFTSPNPDFLQYLGRIFLQIHPKRLVESDPKYFEHPLSAGPYFVKEWVPNSNRALLEENPNYVKGPMAIKQIEIVYVSDLTSRVLQLAQGTLDYVNDLPAGTATDFPPAVKTFGVPIAGTMMIAVNGGKPGTPLANRDVRKAISMAIDREAVAKRAFFGVMKPSTGLIYPDIPEASDALTGGGKRDLAAAKALLASTPYANGFKMTLMTWGQRAGWTNATLVIKENLADLKIDVTVDPVDDAVAIDRQGKGDYEAVFAGVASFPLSVFLGFFGKGGVWAETWGRTKNEALWDLFAKASIETDPAKRLNMYHQANQMEADDMWFIPVTNRVELHGSRVPGDAYRFVKLSQTPMVKTLADALAGK